MTDMRTTGITTVLLAALLVLLLGPAALGQQMGADIIQIYDKDGWRDQKGVTVTQDSIEGVSWKNKAKRTESKKVGEVRAIIYGDAPQEWDQGLNDYANGRYKEAIEAFRGAVNAFEAKQCRAWVKEYAAYHTALCKAAQARSDRTRIDVALGEFLRFIQTYEKSRLLPDAKLERAKLLLMAGKSRDARREFQAVDGLAKANKLFVKYEFEALLGTARSFAMEKDWPRAIPEFQSVEQRAKIELGVVKQATARAVLADMQLIAAGSRGDALLAKAESTKSARDYTAAKNYFQGLRRRLEDSPRVRAMSGVGEAICLLSEDKTREALLKLAEVKVYYFAQHNEVAKALYYMAEASEKLNHRKQAAAYRKELKEHYPDSEWARRAD